jgi:hypothetical protein
MQRARPNTTTSQIVDEGLAICRSGNRYQAAHYMSHYGVAFRVIVRVLMPGGRRRQSARRPV